jgi:hypothetical protein
LGDRTGGLSFPSAMMGPANMKCPRGCRHIPEAGRKVGPPCVEKSLVPVRSTIRRFSPETRSVSLEPSLASHRSIPKQKAATSEAATKEAIQPKAALRDASRWLTAMTAPLKKAQRVVMMSSPKYVSDSEEAMAASSVETLGTMTMYGSLFTIAVVRALLPSRSRSARG